ncbi:hypothetical protein HS088_TW21G00400 [Tripterygium wilfordii]|uniref:Transmembrane protein n=1 Tax=Tripterygium wilfordii TaxID=458696 RepID=A0A7J7C2V1_TRIWF|nr:hypothetical protein HS088_TW21G00400 [Tripterygium wilfordii]
MVRFGTISAIVLFIFALICSIPSSEARMLNPNPNLVQGFTPPSLLSSVEGHVAMGKHFMVHDDRSERNLEESVPSPGAGH